MIDTSKARAASDIIKVEPSNRLFRELGNNTYSFLDVVAELIDNAVAARPPGKRLNVKLTIGLSDKHENTFFEINDDATGISRSLLGNAISPAAIQRTGSLNEHGLGMKQAVASLGTLDYLVTRTEKDSRAIVIGEFVWGRLPAKELSVPWKHGTEIRVGNLNPIVPRNKAHYTRDIVDYLGARYRRLLLPDSPKMKLSLKLVDADSRSQGVIKQYEIEAVRHMYFHPNKRNNKPIVEKKHFNGKGWDAEFTMGYAPSDKEYSELGLDKPTKFHPYHVSIKNQGFDIILHNRVVSFHMLSELDLVQARHNDYNLIRGEIDLKRGFSTAITKNAIMQDQHFKDCIQEIKEFLDARGYLKRKSYPGELPEKLLRDRLADWLKKNDVSPRKSVRKEEAVGGLGGSIDVLADGEPWEVKKDEADGLDVYQLFAYMDMGNYKKGFLVAKGFRTGARSAISHISKKHKRKIVLSKLANYPINHVMTDKEREDYG